MTPSAPIPAATFDALAAAARAAEAGARWDEALHLYEQAFAALPAGGDPAKAVDLLRRVGVLHRERGEPELAREALEAAAAVAGAADLSGPLAAALNDLGGLELRGGNLAAARATYERTRALAAGAGNERLLAVVEQNLGILEDIGGDTEAALARYRRALAVVEHAGDPRAAAMILSNIGLALAALGDPAAAEASFDRAAGIAAGLDDERTLAAVELNRAELLLERGALAEARRTVDRAHAIATRMGSRWRLAQAHRCYGILHREAGEPAAAEEHLARAVELARAAGDRLVEAEAESERGILHFRGGDNRRALRSLNRAHRLYTELGARRELADLDRRLDGLEETYLRVVQRWGEEIESIDGYTAGHCQRVAAYACALAAAVGFGGRDLAWIRMGAFLHDVGKTAVPGAILNKPGPLTPEEWVVMRAHAEAGARIVAELDFPWEVGPMVRNHHERWDGGGYPDGLAGEEIPLTARILCVADCYDALTTPRSYRPALAHAEALAVLADGAGCGFDPRLVAEFHRVVG